MTEPGRPTLLCVLESNLARNEWLKSCCTCYQLLTRRAAPCPKSQSLMHVPDLLSSDLGDAQEGQSLFLDNRRSRPHLRSPPLESITQIERTPLRSPRFGLLCCS
ncbi:hypothetical protein KFK09_026888 [Dendrobium nobile]|uniref:Uncharacterized protein n=1 Tax=Dendrobium nobile TaxID=94219 RepID=A0A8T3A9Y7_DENNO|nr:hypothetical protein KFK09_026888 [Dendrobium nobile]